jgi:hypothetical protein
MQSMRLSSRRLLDAVSDGRPLESEFSAPTRRAPAARDQSLRLLLDKATKLWRREMGLGARGREQPPDGAGNSAMPGLASASCRPALVTRSRSSSLVAAGASATSTSASDARRARKLAPLLVDKNGSCPVASVLAFASQATLALASLSA